jgi:hypothetical protein
MNAIEKYTNDKFIRLLNSFLKKICEPSFKKEYGEHIKLTLYGVMVKSKSLNTLTFHERDNLKEDQAEIVFFIDTNPEESDSEGKTGVTFEDYLYHLFKTRGEGILGISTKNRIGKPFFKIETNKRSLRKMSYIHNPENITENVTKEESKENMVNYEKIEKFVDRFLSKFKTKVNDENFLGYKCLVNKGLFGKTVVKIYGVFKEPFSGESSDKSHMESRKLKDMVKGIITFLNDVEVYAGSCTTIKHFERNENLERNFLNRY